MIGAYLAGWEEIVGIEQSQEYCEIGAARLRFWQGNSGFFEELTEPEEDTSLMPEQMELFAEQLEEPVQVIVNYPTDSLFSEEQVPHTTIPGAFK